MLLERAQFLTEKVAVKTQINSIEKVSIHTEILFVHCYKVFFIITCSFSVFVENCILLPKGINEFIVFLCIVHVWF